jgi:DNA repair exonuclease SbcCD ATPase subunit
VSENKERLTYRPEPETRQKIEQWYEADNCRSMNEFIDKAVSFYADWLSANRNDMLPMAIASAMNGRFKILEKNLSSLSFKHAVELDMLIGIISDTMQIDRDDLKRRRTAANKQSQSGLELDIVDHINTTQRSVNTLSGGEAFLASLALALGLSDEVQMSTGIRLDTLFVDEGFGSLDSEALSKAYATLSGLTEGNRLVGIISHVAELKDRIDRQIVVTKVKSGGSSARIVL